VRSVLVPAWALLAPGMNLSTIRDGAILALAALLVLCCPSSLLAQDSCSTSINPAYCDNCYIDAGVMAIACALTGNCTLNDVYAFLDNCLANTPPPFPPPPTPAPGSGLSCGAEPGVVRAGGLALAQRRLRPESNSSSSSCGITFLDPVPELQDGDGIVTNPNVLASYGTSVSAAAADGAARVVLRMSAAQAGDSVVVTLLDENGNPPQTPAGGGPTPAQQLGTLSSIGGSENQATPLTVTAVAANGQTMAFAVYQPPADFARGPLVNSQDDTLASRTVNFQVQETDSTGSVVGSGSGSLSLLRPPVVLVHGLWSGPGLWKNFLNGAFGGDTRFRKTPASYDFPITVISSDPVYPSSTLAAANSNQLGLEYNAPWVMDTIEAEIADFGSFNSAAVAQADVVAHSLGGLITRWSEKLPAFADTNSFGIGNIHKLITIGTPHFGSPFATLLLQDSCMARRLGFVTHRIAFGQYVVGPNLDPDTSGAIYDLQGDANGAGCGLTTNLQALQNDTEPVPVAVIAGAMTNNFGLLPSLAGLGLWAACSATIPPSPGLPSPLASKLMNWPSVFNGNASDGIVAVTSQLAGNSGTTENGLIHSTALEDLGFTGPAEIDPRSNVQNDVIGLLNAPSARSPSPFSPLPVSPPPSCQ